MLCSCMSFQQLWPTTGVVTGLPFVDSGLSGLTGVGLTADSNVLGPLVTSMKRPFSSLGAPSAISNKTMRRTFIPDTSVFQQYRRYKLKYGRRKSGPAFVKSVVKANTARLDYIFRGINPNGFGGNGHYWMARRTFAAEQTQMPVYFLAANFVNQALLQQDGEATSMVSSQPFRLGTRGDDGSWYTWTIPGQNHSGENFESLRAVSDSMDAQGDGIGPRGYLNWTSLKLTLWGSKTKSTVFYVDLVRPLDHDADPFNYAAGAAMPRVFNQHMDEVMRPLTVHPLARANNISKSPWRVLKRLKVEFDPTISAEMDPDPHCKTVEIFNRWGSVVNFKATTFSPYIGDDDGSVFERPNNGVTERLTSVLRTQPADDLRTLFYVIRAETYTSNDDVSNMVNPSFDLSFRSSWSKL